MFIMFFERDPTKHIVLKLNGQRIVPDGSLKKNTLMLKNYG